MKSENHIKQAPLWWLILIMLGLALATCWWFDREIGSIEQQIENIEKK
ncbi:MAG TPA: hypothetical protein VFV79_08510 [Saprospiraceae bacterium]|nr:hypothetical protein [Saprospiraceae bacterium]